MSGTSSIPGTNIPPVSFPGIASGIDYNSIIQKLTSLSLAPTVTLDAQITTLNNANAELIQINGLLASVQSSLTALSDASLFDAIEATSSNDTFATAQGISGQNAAFGTYTIDGTTLATATQVTGAANIAHVITDAMPGTTTSGADVPLVDSWAAITPSDGTGAEGSITIDGVQINYDVNTQSLNQIISNINAAVSAAGDTTFNMSLGAGGVVSITDSAHPISLGSPSDQGNLLQVLRLDQAQLNNTGSSGSITGTAGVGGLNQALEFNSTNGLSETTDANLLTGVTSGTFTINGVQISVDAATDNLYSVMQKINQSKAGVIAAYNSATGSITLTNQNTGPQSIVLGSGSDTSNFLTALGLTSASGATTSVGQQATVTLETPTGGTQTVYSNSNTVTNAISGVQLNLLSAATSPFQVTVGQDSSQLVSAINTFVSTYNAAINEINNATMAPVVPSTPVGTSVGTAPQTPLGGGVLYGNSDLESIKDELVDMVTAFVPSEGSAYNSLSAIGLQLTDSFTQIQQTSDGSGGSNNGAPQFGTQQLEGTDGQLQALNVTQLQSALAADPSAVQDLFTGASGLVNQVGGYLTGVTGMPTQTQNALVGTIPSVSLIQGDENANTAEIQNLQSQVTQIEDNVNMQADLMRQEFVQSETAIAGYQSMQQQLSAYFGGGTSSSSSGSGL